MAANLAAYRPAPDVVAQHVAALTGPQSQFRRDWSAWLLLGLDDAEIDLRVAAHVDSSPADETTVALTRALALHGLDRVCTPTGEVANLLALAWFEPAEGHGAELVARLERLRQRSPEQPLVTAIVADAAQRVFAMPADVQRALAAVQATSWVEHAALAHALGQPMGCKWVSSPRPAWLPVGHPAELRDPLTAALRRQVLGGQAWRGPTISRELPAHNPGQGLVYLDVDRMKQLLDVYGLRAGDRVLVAVADRLQALVGDRVVRFGGDEFLVIWDGDDVAALGQRLVAELGGLSIADPEAPEVRIALSVSAGSVLDRDLPRALRRVEDAVAAAKQAGRNCARHAD